MENSWYFDKMPELYDAIYRDFVEDIQFWRNLARDLEAAQVLELCSGTGRVTIPLAKKGAELVVTGLDKSTSMLALAKEKAEKENVRVQVRLHFVQGDMADFDLEQCFDLIFVPFSSFLMPSVEKQMSALQCIKKHMHSGSRFALDLFVPDHQLLARAATGHGRQTLVVQGGAADGSYRTISNTSNKYDPLTQIMKTVHVVEKIFPDGRSEKHLIDLEIRVIFPQELRLMLESSGFEVVATYGGYNKEELSANSNRMIWVAKKL